MVYFIVFGASCVIVSVALFRILCLCVCVHFTALPLHQRGLPWWSFSEQYKSPLIVPLRLVAWEGLSRVNLSRHPRVFRSRRDSTLFNPAGGTRARDRATDQSVAGIDFYISVPSVLLRGSVPLIDRARWLVLVARLPCGLSYQFENIFTCQPHGCPCSSPAIRPIPANRSLAFAFRALAFWQSMAARE